MGLGVQLLLVYHNRSVVQVQVGKGKFVSSPSWWFLLGTMIPSFLVSYCMLFAIRKGAVQLGLLDRPGQRKVHAHPIPLGGGLGIWAGLFLTFALGSVAVFFVEGTEDWIPQSLQPHWPGLRRQAGQLWGLLGGGTCLMILGLLDDRRGLPWPLRLGTEILVASLVVYWQGLQLTAFIELPWFTSLLSVLWIVALVNSFNMLDNMDGLSGGVALIVASALALMLLTQPQSNGLQPQLFVASMMLCLAGSLLGFLMHNWTPARIFMGDAGSYFIGYWVAIGTLLANYTGYRSEHPHAILAPLCLLAIPLYDMVSVIWIRLREGRSPFQADRRHFSHRLVELGLSKPTAVLTIYLATIVTSLGALVLPRTDSWGACVVILIVVCMLALIYVLENARSNSPGQGKQNPE